MKLPLKWLSDYVNIDGICTKEYADKMTMSGSKVESVAYLGAEINNVITGKILSTEKHPDSDHLIICQLDVGRTEPIQIVTGAQNVAPNQVVPVAMHKSTLPGGVKITKGKLRGVPSNGMMCSFQELGLTLHEIPYGDENGILIFPEGTPVGEDVRKIVGLDEHVVEFEITSNRPDCLSVIGLARETAATFDRSYTIRKPEIRRPSEESIHDYLKVSVACPDLCKRYVAKVVKDIHIAPSPAWMRERLFAAGVRPINNIVDITNYVMLEYGQPMHAFDYACLSDRQIIVRTAKRGETLETLDAQPRELTDDMLVIADGEKPIGVAGVMGGFNSEISEQTKTIVFESANFSGASVRVTAKKLGMRTEASGRFEKGLDPRMCEDAVIRACELIEEFAAGTVLDGIIDIDHSSKENRTLPLESDKINALLGISVSKPEMTRILETLEFQVKKDTILIPSFRGDIERICDIAEEIARIYGYDKIPTTLYAGETVQGAYTPKQSFERLLSSLCQTVGFDEAMTHSFIGPKKYDDIGLPEDDPRRRSITILNPLGEEFSVMRTTTLPSMFDTLTRNYNFRNATASLFELGTVYKPQVQQGVVNQDVLPTEEKILTLGTYEKYDFFGFKGLIEAILHQADIPNISFEAENHNPSYHPGKCAAILSGQTVIGVFGAIHPAISEKAGFSSEVLTCELNVNAMFSHRAAKKQYTPLPKYPASTRDIAILCDDCIPVAHLENAIAKAIGSILERIQLFDVYKGAQIPNNKKSVAYSIIMRTFDRTLTDEECDAAVKKAISVLEENFGAVLRS